jgi:hypothetical protein
LQRYVCTNLTVPGCLGTIARRLNLLTLSPVPSDEEAKLPEPISPDEKKHIQLMQERASKAVLGLEVRFQAFVTPSSDTFLGTTPEEAKARGRGRPLRTGWRGSTSRGNQPQFAQGDTTHRPLVFEGSRLLPRAREWSGWGRCS